MPAQLEEITIIYLGERHRFENIDGDMIVADARISPQPGEVVLLPENCGDVITIKGQADYNELTENLSYRLYGRWASYTNRRTKIEERQFHFQSFVKNQPYDRAGVIAYLCEAGAGNGVGAVRAATLWDVYQSDAVRMMRETPLIARKALVDARQSITDEQALTIAGWLEEEKHIEACKLELTTLMNGRGFPKTTIREAVREWGNQAAEYIRRNPYLLMKFRGCGFKRTDAMYLDLKLPAGAIKRQTLCAWHSIAKNTEGHTWFPLKIAIDGIRQNISGAAIDDRKALILAKRAKAMSFIRTGRAGELVQVGGEIWCAENRKASNELRLAKYLATALAEPTSWPIDLDDAKSITPHQRECLQTALSGTVAILGGSPGTGKTFTAAELIGLLVQAVGVEQIAVAAPTGKAAVRLTEALESYGLSLRARTIHSLLGVLTSGSGGWGFAHNEQNPLPYNFLIIDESSMIDCDLAASLLSARAKGCHILFIGDVNQLPPVGHGAPLRDMINAKLPYGELREIKRQDDSIPNRIICACASIRDGKPFETCQAVDIDAGENLRVIEVGKPDDQIDKMIAAVKRSRDLGFDPIWDVQVLVPVNAKSPLARKKLNDILQRELNTSPAVKGSPFKSGDKIVNTKNGWFQRHDGSSLDDRDGDDSRDLGEVQTNDRGEVYVANGELAEVLVAEEKLVVAELSNPKRVIRIPRGKTSDDDSEGGGSSSESDNDDKSPTTGCSWDLGYALSVHKSQGSEWPVVIVMIDEYPGAKMVCSREWIYTAISRAKKLCLGIGRLNTMQAYCRKIALGKRKTFLSPLIVRERDKAEQEKQQELVTAEA